MMEGTYMEPQSSTYGGRFHHSEQRAENGIRFFHSDLEHERIQKIASSPMLVNGILQVRIC